MVSPLGDRRLGLRPGGTRRRTLDDGVRLRHVLLLGGHFRRLRRAVRLEVRHRLDLDRACQLLPRLAARVDRPRSPHAPDDPEDEVRHDAAVLRRALFQPRPEDRRRRHRLRLPDPLHRLALQRAFAALPDGVRDRLHRLHHRDVGAHLRLRRSRRLYGDRDQRFRAGAHYADRHHRRDRGGPARAGRLYRRARKTRGCPLGDPRGFQLLLRSRPLLALRRHHPDLARHLGASADGRQVLRHPRQPLDPHRHRRLDGVRPDRGGRVLLPRRLRSAL